MTIFNSSIVNTARPVMTHYKNPKADEPSNLSGWTFYNLWS